MLPRELERIQDQLIRWGYSSRMVEQMQPWSLLNHYENEKKKRGITTNKIMVSNEAGTVNKLDVDNDGKYKGTKVPYRIK